MSLGPAVPLDQLVEDGGLSALVGLVIVRGGGAAPVQRRLPLRRPVTVGRRERHGFELTQEWVPLDLARLTPVADGWLVTNGARTPMSVVNDWISAGSATFKPHATVMLQRGEHRISWPGLRFPLALSVSVRPRRLDDRRTPYAVDATVDLGRPARSAGPHPAMDDAVRYRLAVLYRHLLAEEPAPLRLLRRGAEQLGITEEELDETARRHRRRLNAARGTDLQSLEELGHYLVTRHGELTAADLDP